MIDEALGRMGGAVDRPAPQWCAGFAPDVAAVVSAKGWKSPEEAVRSYMNLERQFGGDRLVVPTMESSDEDRQRFWAKLGRPASPDDYNFEKPSDGVSYDPAHAEWFRGVAHRIGLTGEQAGTLHDAYIDRCRDCMSDPVGESEDSLTQVRRAWGSAFPIRMAEARRALGAYVIEDAELGAIADQIGDVALMNLLAKIGRSLGEDTLVGGRAASAGGTDVRSEIRRMQAEARSDPRHPYLDRSHPEHDTTVRRMQSLFERAYGRSI
ncbi:MAG TPA: hypothetical protein VGM59_02925 [Dongiaceae bacterium]